MLLELEVKNLAILDQVKLELGSGLNVFTGETGAGKSLFFHALEFLLGGDGVGSGGAQAIFRPPKEILEELRRDGFEIDGELYLSRELKPGSRTVSRINGTLVPVAKIKALAPSLAEIHGQHGHHALLNPKTALQLLDTAGGDEIRERRETFSTLYTRWRALQDEKKALEEKAGNREREIDLCRYEVSEIKEAKLVDGEEESLRIEREKLGKIERLQNVLGEALAAVENTNLAKIGNRIETLAPFEKKLEIWISKLREFDFEWIELRDVLKSAEEHFIPEPGRLEMIIDRLDVIHRLQKKYGSSVPEILDYLKNRQAQLETLEQFDEKLAALEKQITEAETKLETLSSELSSLRKKNGDKLQAQLEKELETLALPKARFKVQLESLESWTSTGKDRITFLISLNPGEPLLPLQEVASGGELSRIMLALRTILMGDTVPTLVFDEIDAGLGGEVAFHVAERLKKLAKKKQVLCVTHLHQVAAVADHHFVLEKKTARGKTHVTAKPLNQDEKVMELARMMAGKRASEAAVQHAEELLNKSREKA